MLKQNRRFFVTSVVLILCLATFGTLFMPSTSYADDASDCAAKGGKWLETGTGAYGTGGQKTWVCLGLPASNNNSTPISTVPLYVQAGSAEECAANTSGAGTWTKINNSGGTTSGNVTGYVCRIEPGTSANCVDQWCVDGNTDESDDTSQTPASDITDPNECNSIEGYSWEANESQENGGTCVEKEEKTCGTEVTGIGWLLCPVTNAAIGFADGMWTVFEGLLKTPPLQQSDGNDDGVYYKTWTSIRNLANGLFVVVFLIVIFSQVSNVGISNYGIKKMLPKIIIVAILINVSFFLIQIAIDLSNIAGSTVLDLFNNTAQVDNMEPNWNTLLQWILTIGSVTTVAWGASLAVGSGMIMPLIILLALLIIPAIIGIVAGIIALAVRSALMPIVGILAPLAFVMYIFPNGQSVFDKWRKTFTSLILLYPLAAVYFGALKFTAALMINSGELLSSIIGHALLFIGCFVVFGIAIKGNAITGKMYGAVKNGMNKVVEPVRKVGMGVAGASAAIRFAQFKNRDFSGKSRVRGLNRVGGILQSFDQNKAARDSALGIAKERAQDIRTDNMLDGYDGTVGSINKLALRAAGGDGAEAKVMLDRLRANRNAENLKKSLSTLTEDFAAVKASGGNTDDFLQQRATNMSVSDSDREAAATMAAQMGRDKVLRNIQAHATGIADPATKNTLQTSVQKAISSNASALSAKAPDLVKGRESAFNSVNGEQLTSFSKSTMQEYLNYVETELGKGNSRVAQSLSSAVDDITRTPQLQARVDGEVGAVMRDHITASSVLSGNANAAAAAAAVHADGKIR